MANITIDVQARVVGYQESIKQLQAALTKVDPGSAIGKKLAEAFEQAQSQVKALGKNMFPKASSDTQIDAIVEKVNRAGEAIQHVSTLLSTVGAGDLNLGVFGDQIKDIINQISQLQSAIDTSMTGGIQSAIASSQQLQQVFAELGIDITKVTAESGKEALAAGLDAAKASAEEAKQAFDKAAQAVSAAEQKLKSIKNVDVFGNNFDLNQAIGQFTALKAPTRTMDVQALENIKQQIEEKINKTDFTDKINLQQKIDAIFSQINPSSTAAEFKAKWDELRKLINDEMGKDTVLTGFKNTDNIFNKIFQTDPAEVEKVRSNFLNVFNQFASLFSQNASGTYAEKITKGGEAFEKAISDVIERIRSKYELYNKEVNKYSAIRDTNIIQRDAAQGVLTQAENKSQLYESAQTDFNRIVENLQQQVQSQADEIRNLKAQIEQLTSGQVNKIKEAGQNAGSNARQQMFPTEQANQYHEALERVKSGEQMLGKLQGVVQRWFSIYAVIRMVTNAIKKAGQNIQELDSTMTEIAIVTKMDQGDLWAQMPKYTKMARDYASSIKGVYEVSQIYYQQGLQMNEVMDLTESTLKMARISGLGYSEAADYMTNAVRSFKMEMSEASRVVDVYSAVAASSASNVQELATAMSKTASSAQAVGSSFENTTAMLAVMIEATRESPENIGSAMKSIISRYGELKENKTGIDEEGETYSLNKVDTALQSVGISIHDVNGEFRDFDEVIFELAEHWNEIDKNTQRYIATVMAGNRQQSRFLALVSSSDRLKEEREKAENSEDASQLQFLKTLDSIDAKKQQLETSIQSIYTSSGVENVYKGLLDFANNVLVTFDNLSSESGLGTAVAKIGATFTTLATLVVNVFKMIKAHMTITAAEMTADARAAAASRLVVVKDEVIAQAEADNQRLENYVTAEQKMTAEHEAQAARRTAATLKEQAKTQKLRMGIGMAASTIGLGLTTAAASLDVNKDREKKAWLTGIGSALNGVGTGAMIGGVPGVIIGALTAIPGIIEAIGMASESVVEKVNRLQSNIDTTKNEKIKAKDDLKTLNDYKSKYDELSKTQYESAEKQKEFKDLQNEIAEKYPSLITAMDSEGNALVNMSNAYKTLQQTKMEAYSDSFIENLGAELDALKDIDYVLQSIYGIGPQQNKKGIFGINLDSYEKFPEYFQQSLNSIYENGKLAYNADHGLIFGDAGFSNLVSDNKRGNLSRLFNLDANASYDAGLYQENLFSSSVTKSLLGKIYGIYEKGVLEKTAYEDIDISSQLDTLFSQAIESVKGYDDEEYAWFKAMSEEERGDYLKNFENVKMSDTDYAVWKNVHAANQYSQDAENRLIESRSAEVINALDETYGDYLDFDTTKLQKYAAKYSLQGKIKKFWEDSSLYLDNENYQYLDENGNAQKYDAPHLLQDYLNGGIKDKTGKTIAVEGINLNEVWYQNILEEYSYLGETLDDLYTNLGKSARGDIEKNLAKYISRDDTEKFDNIVKLLDTAFGEQYDTVIERYQNWAKGLEENISNEELRTQISNFSNIFGPEYLQGIQDQYKTIIKNTGLSDSQKETQAQELTDIFNTISEIENPDISSAVLAKIQTADLTSLNGIFSLLEVLADIEDFDLEADKGKDLKEKLIQLSKNLRVNVSSEINSYFDSIETASEGFDKALSSATSGMDLKAAKEMADKVGVTLKDFTIKDGKFFYDDLNKIAEAYTIDAQDRFTELKENVTKRYEAIAGKEALEGRVQGKDILSGRYSVKGLKTLLSTTESQEKFSKDFDIDYNEFIKYYEQYQDYIENFEGEGNPLSLIDWIGQNIDEQMADSVKALEEWQTQTQAISELKNGKLEGFLKTTGEWQDTDELKQRLARAKNFNAPQEYIDNIEEQIADTEQINADLINAISTGKVSKLSEENQKKYGKLVRDTYKAVQSSLMTSIFDAIEGGTSTLEVTEANEEYLKKLKSDHPEWIEGNIEAGQQIELQAEKILADESNLWSVIQNSYDNEKDRLEAFKNYHDKKYSKNKLTALEGITDGEIAYGDFLDYLTINKGKTTAELFAAGEENTLSQLTNDYGLQLNAAGDFIVSDWTKYIKQTTTDLNDLISTGLTANGRTATIQDINRARAAVQTAQRGQQTAIQDATSNILDNYEDVSIEQQEALANALGMDSNLLFKTLYHEGIDGKTNLNIGAFKSLINTNEKITDETRQLLNEQFASISDDFLNNIKDASSLVTSGTTSQADIQEFKAKAQELGMTISDSAFAYDSILDAWTLDPSILREYMIEQAKQLVEQGLLTKAQVEDYINNNIIKNLAQQVDISGFLKAENKTGQAKDKLKTQLVNYFNAVPQAIDDFVNTEFAYVPEQYREYIKKGLGAEGVADSYIKIISNGGAQAVAVMQAFADASNIELSSSDIEAAWRTEVSAVEEAFDQLLYGPGSLVSGKAKEILEKLSAEGKASITAIDANNAVVNSITDVAAAYQAYYDALAETGEATLAALNEAQAKVFETQGRRSQEQAAIDALGDASGMTYSAFAEIFTNAGYELTDELMQQLGQAGIVQAMGGNKMRISDFATFARLMKWDFNSEEYISAFKTYNDSLIEINHKVESDIAAEINSLGDAKGGDWLNVTGFYTALMSQIRESVNRDQTFDHATGAEIQAEIQKRFSSINDSLLAFGAYIEDGILKLDENANLAGIATVLKDQLKTTGLDMSMEIDSILDTIDNIIDTYISSIDAGINGSLSHQDAATLRRTAASYGVENLDFMETAEGLKLTNESIFELYSSIRKINQLSAKKLLPGIKDLNSKYGDLGSAMREYEQQLKAGNVDTAKAIGDIITEYLSSPDSFDFTRGQNTTQDEIAKNIYESGYRAYNIMNAAKKTGTMAYDDFTSMMAQLYKTNPDAQVGTTGKTVRELYENRFGYIDLDSSGNAIFRIKEMGLDEKNIGSLQDMIINYMKTTIDASNNQQETYNNLRKAAESTAQVVNKYDKGGKLSADEIAKIAKESTDLQSTLASIPGGQSIYDKLIGKEGELSDAEVERWGTFLKQFGETDFTLEDFTTQLGELLGDGYVLDMDANGKLTINIKPEYKFPDGTQLHGSAAKKWREAASKALNKDIHLDQKTIDYKMGQYTVKFKVDIDAKTGAETVTYTVETKNDTYESSTEAGLRQALKDQETIVQEQAESAISSSDEDEDTYSYTIKGKNLKVIYGKDNISVEWLGSGTDTEGIDLAAKTQEQLNNNFKDLKDQVLHLDSDQVINATVSATGDYTIQWQETPDAKIQTINISSVEMATMGPDALKIVQNAISKCDGKVKVGLIDNATKGIENIRRAIESIKGEHDITFNVKTKGPIPEVFDGIISITEGDPQEGKAGAKGNLALARGTLMGELGPELVVSGGHYYVVGQNGAEMVDLPKDAIVFNHLQTASLLRSGSSTRGKAVTNELNAAGVAHPNGTPNGTPNFLTGLKTLWNSLTKNVFSPVINTIKTFAENTVEKITSASTSTKQKTTVETKIEALAKANYKTAKEEKEAAEAEIKRLKESGDSQGIKEAIAEQEKIVEAAKKRMKELSNAASDLSEAAKAQSDAANTTADTTANIARVASHIDDELLHTGYKRKASTSDTDNGNNKKRKLNFSDATTSGGGHWETIIKGKAVDASSEDQKNADNAIKAVQTVISNLLSQGFENINLDDSAYDNLDKDLKAEMKEYIKRADASYRDFVALYAGAADLSTKEFNEKYFEAWQADIYNPGSSNEALEAAEGLTFFASGKIAGSSDDWTTLFGEYTDVSELVEAGIIEWDSQLRQYVITSIDALKEYDTNLNAIDNLPAMQADDILDQFKDIQSKLQSSLEGTISNMDILNFKHQLELNGIDVDNLDFRETAEGLKLSEESAISIYDVLTKIDGLQADVTFEKLKENLEQNNVNYKDAASINKRIFDLRSMIAELPADDARIKQYKAELKLAEQIRDVRIATEDESYKKMGSGISGGINNPINLVKDYTSITQLWSEGTASLEDMYNLMERINASAKDQNKTVKFGSLTLDGTEESLTQAWQDLFQSGALKINEDGEQMVDTNVLGLTPEALKASTDDLIARFDDERQAALKALTGAKAKASIKEAFDSLNISGYGQNDILNGSAYTEQFKADAINMLQKAASDNRLMDSLKNIAVGERTLYDVLTDAESGQNAVETAEQLTEALALITSYEGDSAEELERQKIAWENTDLDSIRKNIEDISNATTAYVGEIEKWFNYLRQIEKLTELINRAEKERSVIESGVLSKDGNAYFDSQIKSLAFYKQQIAEVNDYMPEFQKSLEQQWENVKTNGLDKIFKRDEATGAVQYETGIQAALEQIFNIDKVTGKPNTSNASAQEAQLRALLGDESFDALSKYNSSGELIVQGSKTKDEYTAEKVQAIYDAIQNTYGEINADVQTIINADNTRNEALQSINTIEQSMVDNQITLENKVLQAIEDTRQAEINDAQKTRDAYKKSTDAYINGLRDMVNKEKQLHERDKDNQELVKLQRQRDILLRSGGSASEIANLNNEINDKQYDAYIQAQEDQISSIEDANTAALERLDKQISLMEETLQYEKEHGMLWDDVYNIMSQGSDYIISFLEEYTTEWQSQSSAQLEQTVKQASFEAAQWTKLYNKNGIAAIIAEYDDDETVAARADIIAGKIDEKVEEKLKEFQAEQESANAAIKSVISASSNEDNGSIGDAAFIDNTISADSSIGDAAFVDRSDSSIGDAAFVDRGGSSIGDAAFIDRTNSSIGDAAFIDKNNSIGDAAFIDRSGSSIGDAAFIVTDEQVKVLRDDMIGNNHNPLMNALLDSNDAYKNFVSSTYDSISNASNNSTIIEHAEVNVNVDKLANSYDASKAGDDIMKEMLSIARKTNAQNRVGR